MCDLVQRGALAGTRPEEALLSVSPHHPLQEACLWYALHPLASVRGDAFPDQSPGHAALALVAELHGYGDKVVKRALCALCDGQVLVQQSDAASGTAEASVDGPQPVPPAALAALARADTVAEFRAARTLAFAIRRHALAEEEQRSLQAAMAVDQQLCPPPRRRMSAEEEAEEAAAARARAVTHARGELTHVAACDGDAASVLWRCVNESGVPVPVSGGNATSGRVEEEEEEGVAADATVSTLRRRRRASLKRHFGHSLSSAARAVQASMRLLRRVGAAGARPAVERDCLAAALRSGEEEAVYRVHMRTQLSATPRRLATPDVWAAPFAGWLAEEGDTGSVPLAWARAARYAALASAAAVGRDTELATALTGPSTAAGVATRLSQLVQGQQSGGSAGPEAAILLESCALVAATPGTDGGAALWGALAGQSLVPALAARVAQVAWCPVGTALALLAAVCVRHTPHGVRAEDARTIGRAVASSLALSTRTEGGEEEEKEEAARARLLRSWALTCILRAHPAAAAGMTDPLRSINVWTAAARRLGSASAQQRTLAHADLALAAEMATADLGPPPATHGEVEGGSSGLAAAQDDSWTGLLPQTAAAALTALTGSSPPASASLPVVSRVEVGAGLCLAWRPRRDAARLVASASSRAERADPVQVAALRSCLGALNEWDRSAVAHARATHGGGEEEKEEKEKANEVEKGQEDEEHEGDGDQDTFQRSMQQLLDPAMLSRGPERVGEESERTPRPLSRGLGSTAGMGSVVEEEGEEEAHEEADDPTVPDDSGRGEHEAFDALFSFRLVALPVSGFCEALRGVRCQLRFAAGRATLLGVLPQPASALEAYGGVQAGTTVESLALPRALRTCLYAVAAAVAHLRWGRALPPSLLPPRAGTAGADSLAPGLDAWTILAEGCGAVGEALRRSLWLRLRLGSAPAVTGLMRELLAVACGEGVAKADASGGNASHAAQVEAARCVGAFARACRGNQDALVAASVVGLLGGLLHSTVARVRAAACDAVADVAEGNRAAAAGVRAAGGLARLVEMVDTQGAAAPYRRRCHPSLADLPVPSCLACADLRPDGPSSRACATQTCLLRWDPATRDELVRCGGLRVLAAQVCALPLTQREVGRAADALRGSHAAPARGEGDLNGSVTAAAALSQALKGSSGSVLSVRGRKGDCRHLPL